MPEPTTAALLTEIRDALHHYVPRGYVDLPAVMTYLDRPEGTIREWIRTKSFPAYKAGKGFQFKLSEVDRWMAKYRVTR